MTENTAIRMKKIDWNDPYSEAWRTTIIFEDSETDYITLAFVPVEEKVEGPSAILCIALDKDGRIMADDDLQPVYIMKTGRAYWEYTQEVEVLGVTNA